MPEHDELLDPDHGPRAEGTPDPAAWIVEAATRLLLAYTLTEENHLARGLWQLNVIDGTGVRTSAGVEAAAVPLTSVTLGTTHTAWQLPATDDIYTAHHLWEPAPIDTSGMVLIRRAWVGNDPHRRHPITVLGAHPLRPDQRPEHRAFPLVPAIVAYAVPHDHTQHPVVLVRLLCTVAEAVAAHLLDDPKPQDLARITPGPRSAQHFVRRLPGTHVAHAPTLDPGPLPWLRWAMTGQSGLALNALDSSLPHLRAALMMASLAEAAATLVDLPAQEREAAWGAAVDGAEELLNHHTWATLRADQAGPRLTGTWVPATIAEHCAEDLAMFASVLLTQVPAIATSAAALADSPAAALLGEVPHARTPAEVSTWLGNLLAGTP